MTQPRHLRIFLGSPGDVTDERSLALDVIEQLPYDPLLQGKITLEAVAWDKAGARHPMLANMTPQEAIAQRLPRPSNCDVVVIIFWSRMGTLLPEEWVKPEKFRYLSGTGWEHLDARYLSGTEWEYFDALQASEEHAKPKILVYRRTEKLLLDPDKSTLSDNVRQREFVSTFFHTFSNSDGSSCRGYNEYQTPEEFGKGLESHLKFLIKEIIEQKPVKDSMNNGMLVAGGIGFALSVEDRKRRNLPEADRNHDDSALLDSDSDDSSAHYFTEDSKMDEQIGSSQLPLDTIGMPGKEGQSASVYQDYESTSAIRSQELILRDFGIDISQEQLIQTATSNGWYTPSGGTSPEHVGNLLEGYGVQVNRYQNANIFALTSELAQNHKIIIGVDSGKLWNEEFWEAVEDSLGTPGGDHVLLVSGIDTTDPGNVKVVLTNPSTGDIVKEYPLDRFMSAWKDSPCFIVATTEPAPAWLAESIGFDYDLGHLEDIGGWKFEELVAADAKLATVLEEIGERTFDDLNFVDYLIESHKEGIHSDDAMKHFVKLIKNDSLSQASRWNTLQVALTSLCEAHLDTQEQEDDPAGTNLSGTNLLSLEEAGQNSIEYWSDGVPKIDSSDELQHGAGDLNPGGEDDNILMK